MPEGMAWHSLSNPWIQMFLDQRCEPLPRPQWTHRHRWCSTPRRNPSAHVMKLYDAIAQLSPTHVQKCKVWAGYGRVLRNGHMIHESWKAVFTWQHHAQKPSPAHFSAGGFGRLSGALQLSSTPSSLEACRECVRAPAARHQSRDGTRGQHHSRYVSCYARLLISYSIKT